MTDIKPCRYAAPRHWNAAPRGLRRDSTWFAPEAVWPPPYDPLAPMAGCETVMIERAMFVPEPFAVFDATGRLHAGTMPGVMRDMAPETMTAPIQAPPGVQSWLPIAAGVSVPLGRFLGEALSTAVLQHAAQPHLGLIGAPLTPAQMDAMIALNLLGFYTPVDRPTVLARLHLSRTIGRGPSRMMRPPIEALRFTAEPYEVRPRISMLAPQDGVHFSRSNHGSLRAWLRARSFGALDAVAMTLDATRLRLNDMIATLAGAQVVVIDDPNQAALLGLCDPGTVVLELGVDGWHDGTIMAVCALFGLEWRLVVAAAPRYPIKTPLPLGATRMLHIEADIAVLDAALASVDSAANVAIS
jgi:hypothetical protein